MSIEPVLAYAHERRKQIERQSMSSSQAISDRVVALDEIDRVIVLCEGLLAQEKLILSALKPTPAQLAG